MKIDNIVEDSADEPLENFEIDIDIRINRMMSLKEAKQLVERELITKVMDKVGSTYKAAKILEVSQATISRKSKRYKDEIFSTAENN
ncbi:hypothetical protein SAMN02745751_02010 [Dethiosulfatibacter aminovorans DSM 17477]|uniref:TyrR-like helix-turn-helix domain-containing protein n=1 Tax=Dethiosulfatibacter aminovorans DSM 17477 TaxID=1121476 RepID=A0A1M6HGH0_9FIRM|nr:hypothetical protein [Dethiosulfatibacter aminovorans]SHJ21267.1 hypothetical protein SAMN02745751_02010 [Dethiosulfatibacter aminovorans DSM 17477]